MYRRWNSFEQIKGNLHQGNKSKEAKCKEKGGKKDFHPSLLFPDCLLYNNAIQIQDETYLES